MIGIVGTFVFVVAVYIYRYYANVRRYPKGPTPLPLIGNLHQFDPNRLHHYFERVQAEYGDVFTVWTPAPMVILMSYSTIKEALVTKGDDFLGRMGRFPDDVLMATDNGGVIFSDGENWREQRRTAVHILRDFGMGRNVMEAQVKVSMDEFMRHLESIEDKSSVDFRWPLQARNIFFEFLYSGCKRDQQAPVRIPLPVQRLQTTHGLFRHAHLPCMCSGYGAIVLCTLYVFENVRASALSQMAMQFPWIARLPVVGWLAVGQHRKTASRLQAHIRTDIQRCTTTFNDNDEPACFVHAYMQRMAKNPQLTEDQMVNVCGDFFFAGMETTSTTLRWAMLHMAKNLRVQDKIRAEIHAVLGKDGEVTMNDKMRLPYTSAAVSELQRMANIVPLNVFHRTVTDTKVDGHSIPSNTIIIAQIHNVMKRGEIFENADEFRPERFLMEDGKTPNRVSLLSILNLFFTGNMVSAYQ
ncbi:hypothetical protein PRIPAC_80902 [Pristionchus pacificus]|uniref:Cytochrome P450 n=1 Tax=Pristionchus pacificus TaxID=54126 RepID=A0A2A6CP52_PRIPA|nr:hypothetical protein PRIPAC_80902 [Pristionchus pacificus]|eukprot:PDM79801.1 cytochrome P450 [Pristionchus pacificus]